VTAAAPDYDRRPPLWGRSLSEADYAALEASWITREIADFAMLRRVDEHEGREVVGQKGKRDCAGILIPYYWPGQPWLVNYRLRRDRPELVQGKDGRLEPNNKYLGAPGAPNRLYVPPGITSEQLADATLPITIVEGEKKALALWRLANHEVDHPRFVVVAIPGVWNWRGTVGKTGGPNGERIDVKGPIADLDRINWTMRIAFVVFDANVHRNDSVRWARNGLARELTTRSAIVKLINLPEDCGVNGIDDLLGIWGPNRVLDLFDHAASGAQLHVVPSPQFKSRPDGMFRVLSKGERLDQVQLSNYSASIKTNVTLDDGVETKREFGIETELLGRNYQFTIPASQFAVMNWPIDKMGPGAITFPGQQDYARTAIQSFSLAAQERHVYTHTGWRKFDGHWLFLHAGGALGQSGEVPAAEVRLNGALSRYELGPPCAADLPQAIRASLQLVELAPPSISFPLLAATFRSVFGSADFALHLAGETGAFKSELAALHQQHFGAAMSRLNLPGNWSSTGNALEILAFHSKDVLLVIDDFAPQGSTADVAKYHATAERIFRAAGNHAGRSRLDSTAKLREAKPPRALILSTGEDIPRGHSIRARLLMLELARGSIKSNQLSSCQMAALSGRYAQNMSAFIQWLAARYDEALAIFERRLTELRLNGLRNAAHARTPEIIANLQAAFEQYLEFAEAVGVVSDAERAHLEERCWEALGEAAAAQAKHHLAIEPTARFLDTLRALLASGRVHCSSRRGNEPDRLPGSCGWRRDHSGHWVPRGDCIGWVEGDDLYLEPVVCYRVVQTALRDSGESLSLTDQVLRKRLHEKGLLASVESGRETLTIRKSIGGCSRRVLHLARAVLLPEDPENEITDG
jgi:hypothetical protein